jgi:putative DNA methylase
VAWVAETLAAVPAAPPGEAHQRDAVASVNGLSHPLISTDPPYYDNIGYADLSDFFYVWLRRALRDIYPDLFATLLTPKASELVATPYRFAGSRARARAFFEEGLGRAFANMRAAHHPDYPLTVYYAFKQTETEDGEDGEEAIASTGWETMLTALLTAGFQITGTWPMRTELLTRSVGLGANALASSIILVCRPRPVDAPLATRRELLAALQRELPPAIRRLQQGNIAPVDLQQAAIGPGMAIFSRYRQVTSAGGQKVGVREALGLINRTLDEVLAEQEGDFDPATRWAIVWFEQHGLQEGPYGDAETLSKAKNTAVEALVAAGLVHAQGGNVRLRHREELAERPELWQPDGGVRAWEVTQRLILALQQGGEEQAARLLVHMSSGADMVRELVYRLYTISDRQGWTQEAIAYNSLIASWPEIAKLAGEQWRAAHQAGLFAG